MVTTRALGPGAARLRSARGRPRQVAESGPEPWTHAAGGPGKSPGSPCEVVTAGLQGSQDHTSNGIYYVTEKDQVFL